MTPAQKKLRELEERKSHERQRYAELGMADSLTTETRAELDATEQGTPDLERQIRAARIAVEQEEGEQRVAQNEAAPDAEMRERIELRGRARLTEYFKAWKEGRQVGGAEGELRAAAGVSGIPIEILDTPAPQEQRTVTGSPSTVGVHLDRIRPAVFANAVLPMLGVEMPRVDSGTYASATIGTSLTASAKTKGDAQVGTAATFSVTTATPKRISARLELTLEDIKAVGAANFESSLRENLSLALSDALDTQGLTGDGVAPNLAGLISRFVDPTDPGGVADFDAFAAAHANAVDGLWAKNVREVSILAGNATYSLSARTFQSTTTYKGEMSAAAYAEQHTGGWMTHRRMPAVASKVEKAIVYRKGRSFLNGGAGSMRTAVCPHWGEVGIDDIYSGSGKAERYFTLHVMLGDVIVVQPDAYDLIEYKVVA